MRSFRKALTKALILAASYLFIVILGGFFILPGVFQVDYNLPVAIEGVLKITTVIAAIVVLLSAVLLPALRFKEIRDHARYGSPLVFAITFLAGVVAILIHAVYVKLRTCAEDSTAWHCSVDGKSYVGMLVIVFFLACVVSVGNWVVHKLAATHKKSS